MDEMFLRSVHYFMREVAGRVKDVRVVMLA